MKDYQAKNIRNIAVVGHGSEGKTTLVEALLYTSGTIDRQGRVEDGNTVTDSDKEEQSRQISISAAVAPLEWKDVKVNLIDVPGYFDFAGEMVGPMAVAEGAIITVGAVSGLNVGAEKAWDMCDKTHTSRMIVINQMDRENANFSRALSTITDKYGSHIAPIEVPIVEGGKFTGVVCVLENKAYTGEGKTLVAVLPAYLNALTGEGVHIVTVNDYLARRDSEWMGKVRKRSCTACARASRTARSCRWFAARR